MCSFPVMLIDLFRYHKCNWKIAMFRIMTTIIGILFGTVY